MAFVKVRMQPETPNQSPLRTFPKRLQQTIEVNKSLETWWEDFVAWAPKPLYIQSSTSQSVPECTFVYQDLRLAHLCMIHWALQLVLCIIMTRISDHTPADAKATAGVQQFLAVASRHGGDFQLATATKITNSIGYTRRPEMGYVGPQITLFPIRVALTIFHHLPGSYPRYQAPTLAERMKSMAPEYGLRFAEDLETREEDLNVMVAVPISNLNWKAKPEDEL